MRSTGIVVCAKILVAAVLLMRCSSLLVSNSNIEDVTIGGFIAKVTRTFTVNDVLPGTQAVSVHDLPDTIDENSIQVVGKSNAEVISTVVQNQVFHRESDPDFQARIEQITEVFKAIAQLSSSVGLQEDVLSARLKTMKRNVDYPINSSAPIPLQQLTEILDYQEREQMAVNERRVPLRSISKATASWMDQAIEMQNKLRTGTYRNLLSRAKKPQHSDHPALAPLATQLSGVLGLMSGLPAAEESWPVAKQVKELHINLHVPEEGSSDTGRTLDFELSYMVSPASWEAEYDLRVERVKASAPSGTASEGGGGQYAVRVGMYAVVAQATAEDWRDVRLHLSTTQAQRFIAAPAPPVRLSLSLHDPDQQAMHGQSSRFSTASPSAAPSAQPSAQPSAVPSTIPSAGPASWSSNIGGVGVTGGAGQVGSPVVFHPEHRVNISSNTPATHARLPTQTSPASTFTRNTRIFIRDTVLNPTVFTYAVPTSSGDKTAYLKAWTTGGKKSGPQSEAEVPLLASQRARVFMEDTFAGTTSVRESQPGSPVRLDLGPDKNIQLQRAAVLPRKGSQTEDKSTWFVTDKVKYLVESAEYAFSVRSSYAAPHLVVLSELLPHVGEEDIKLELLQPAASAVQTLSLSQSQSPAGPAGSGDVWGEEDYLAAVLAHPSLARPVSVPASPATDTVTAEPVQMLAFSAKGSGNVVWAQWLQPGQTAQASLHYRIIYPEGRVLTKQRH